MSSKTALFRRFLALIIEKEANGRLEDELYKGGRRWLVAHTRLTDWRKKGKRWMESMYHNIYKACTIIYILYTLLYIGAYNINHNTWSYFKKTK